MVVPRSSVEVDHDDEFTLFAVATFKKYSAEFINKCREQKWTPRQYTYVQGGREEEQRELDRVTNEERKVCGEALRIGRTGWSESVMVWIHVLTLRVFVEAVLRYGLPLEYATALVKVCARLCILCPCCAWEATTFLALLIFGLSGFRACELADMMLQRRRQSRHLKSKPLLTRTTRTWEATHLDATSEAGSRKTMRQ